MHNISTHLPINQVSLGFVSYNILREFDKLGQNFDLFPVGNLDFSSFDKCSPELRKKIEHSVSNSQLNYKKENKQFKVWHLNQAGQNQNLFTFFELDQLTPTEVNVIKQQNKVFVSSQETKQIFEQYGADNVVYAPLGFDNENFYETGKRYLDDSITTFSIFGKHEKRKNHDKVIKAWIKKYGNRPEFRLHCHIFNIFYSPEQNRQVAMYLLGGQQVNNVQFFPYTQGLSEFNDALNCCDIVLDLSGGEGWSLPSFHCVGLGKHALIHNCSAMKEWATKENSVLMEPVGKEEVYDNVFFHKGAPFNQGNIYKFDETQLDAKFDEVYEKKRLNKVNIEGKKLKDKFKWENTAKIILNEII